MRKFTKSLLTLALLVLAVGGVNASVETVIKSFDYTTNPVKQDGVAYYQEGYPFYSQTGWWSATEATAPTLNNGSLELGNNAANEYKLFILDWATVKKGYGYKAKITYKSTAAGSVNFSFGTWSATLNKDGVAIEATDAWKTLLVDLGTANFEASAAAHLFWIFSFAGTINIKEVEIIQVAPDLVYLTEEEKFEAPAGTSDINGLSRTSPDYTWSVTYPKEMGPGVGWCGDIDSNDKAVDISTYKYLHFVVTNVEDGKKVSLRVFVWNGTERKCLYPYPIGEVNGSTNYETVYYITAPGTYVVEIQGNPLLRGFKGGNGWGGDESNGKAIISQAYVSSGNDPVAYTPTGETTVYGTDYLNDPTITCIDATALITNGQTLNAANPNALFIAKAGQLNNTKNVIVNGTCANLELVDGKPFNVPAAFTATAAKFTKTVGDAGYATMVIPFGAALPTGVEAYNITGNNDNVLTTTTAEAIVANKPVMLKNAGDYNFTASNVAIAATTDGVQNNGLLYGAYTAKAVPTANTYVLQKQGDDVNFYKAIDGLTVNPFRAYLTASAGARLTFDFNETNGIKSVETTADNRIYNIQGVRVDNPTKGLYIVNGKKAIVK